MFWVPYAGNIPLGLVWPSEVATTSLSLAAFIAAARLALLIVRAARTRAVAVPAIAIALEDERDAKPVAA